MTAATLPAKEQIILFSYLSVMPVRRAIPENDGIYFITVTCARWLKLFEITNGYDIVYKWFDYLKNHGHFINGYVIMPNHFHALIAFRNSGKQINKIVGDGKRFMSYEIVNRLNLLSQQDLLDELQMFVNKSDRKKGKRHEVFEPSFDWKECYGSRFIEQKLNYIHDNPCQPQWNLVQQASDYIHSSARFYETGEEGVYGVTNYSTLEDIDLSGKLS